MESMCIHCCATVHIYVHYIACHFQFLARSSLADYIPNRFIVVTVSLYVSSMLAFFHRFHSLHIVKTLLHVCIGDKILSLLEDQVH